MPENSGTQAGVNNRIDVIIDAPAAAGLVGAFFDPDGPFAGATFVTLDGRSGDPNRIDIGDLLAVSFLDVALRPAAVRSILGKHADEFEAILTRFEDKNLWEADDHDLEAAEEAFDRLKSLPYVGPVIAGKLLARKRPRLIPVVDRTVERAIQAPVGRYWVSFREALKDDDRRRRVEELAPTHLGVDFPLLRIS